LYRETKEKIHAKTQGVFELFEKSLEKTRDRIISFQKIPKENDSVVVVEKENSKNMGYVPDESIELIITSPPYGDSKTTVAYGQYSRLPIWWLFPKEELKEVSRIDNYLLGGGKRAKSPISSETFTEIHAELMIENPKRATEVEIFYQDLEDVLKETYKKTKKDGLHFWVVGNRTVLKKKLPTNIILCEMAKHIGFEVVWNIPRKISNKVMPSKNSPTNIQGDLSMTMSDENIVILRKK
jgi:GTPase SAR1 family protein